MAVLRTDERQATYPLLPDEPPPWLETVPAARHLGAAIAPGPTSVLLWR